MAEAISSGTDSATPVTITRAHYVGWAAMVVGMFMAILDIQIVASSLPNIQAGLAASPDEISWVQTSYLIAEVVMIPLSGYLARVFSTRILFTVSAIGFTAASVACAFAWSLESLIIFRIIQGFLGGAMIPTVFSTSYLIFTPKQQTVTNVIVGLIATAAPTIGPTLGGWITETISWHWLFLINVIPGIVIVMVVSSMPPLDRPNYTLLKGFDLIGLTLMALFLGSLEFVMDEGPRDDWFDKPIIFYLTVVSIVAGSLFFWRMLRYHNPIVDIRAFKDRNFALGSIYSFIIGVGLYGSVYMAPLFLSQVRGYNALQIGVVMMVTGIFQFLSAPVAGRLSTIIDLRLMLAIGLALFAGGTYLNHFATADWSLHELFIPQAIRGFALMFLFIPVNTLALGTLPPDKIKNASGLYNLMRNLGGAIGLAVINTLMTDRLHLHMARLSDRLDPSRPEFKNMLEGLSAKIGDVVTADPDAVAMKLITSIVQREAIVLTFNDLYLIMSLVFLSGLLLMPLVRKPQNISHDAH